MIRKILFFFTILMINGSIALAQEVFFQNTIGGTNDDVLFSVLHTTDGGFMLGGYSSSGITGDKTEIAKGATDYWIIKTDSIGNIEWQNTIGGSGEDQLTCVKQTSDGGYMVGGYSKSYISGDKTFGCNGQFDYWIVKTDSLGVIQWQRVFGGNNYDYLFSVNQTSDNGYILGGYSISGISYDKTEASQGGWDFWIIKTDSLGNQQWQNTIGGSDDDWLKCIVPLADGKYILGGVSTSGISGDKTEACYGSWDYWIVCIDSTGNILSQKTIGGSDSDILNIVQQTSDNGFILGGASASNISGDKIEDSHGDNDFWILKTDSALNIQWQNTIGGSGLDQLNAIVQDIDGSFLFGGHSNSDISGDKTEDSNGEYDFWLVKTDPGGNIIWQNSIGGNTFDYLFGMDVISSKQYMVAGYSYSPTSGDKSENCWGGSDYWITAITDRYNFIKGKVFADLNSNAIQDPSEPLLPNVKITEANSGRFAFTGSNGNYSLMVLDSGSYEAAPSSFNNFSSVPFSQSAFFNGNFQTDSLNDFALQPQTTLNDLCINITPQGPFRSGFDATYLISYSNVGPTTVAPVIVFFPDTNVSYLSSPITPYFVSSDSVIWNLNPITPFQSGSLIVSVKVDLALTNGTLINSSVRIDPVAGDANPACNYSSWEVFVTGSVDPNDILVNEDTLTTTQLSAEPFLDYIIRFQNTGNDTAFTVKILNLIDTTKLNLSSFEFLSSSHNVELKWLPWERNMEFLFNNILLPDSNVNEPLSHGNVRYRIKPKPNIAAGDSIANRAAIYFDYNSPVLTNTAVTKIILLTDLHSVNSLFDYQIYPNPTTGAAFIEINAKLPVNTQISLNTIEGKLISIENHNLKPGPNKLNLNTAELSSGIYLVRMVIDGNTVVKKLVKM